jgi:SAM-dependent methyltransferase
MSGWNTLARLDPLWAILTDPIMKFGRWEPGEFFHDGECEAERVLAMCRSNRLGVSSGKLLDFGCGVGRMTRAFSSFFKECVGIDVSLEMVNLAKRYNSDRPQCKFMVNTETVLPFEDKSFDFVFSVLVLQHLARKREILGYIAEFIRVAKEGGVVVFQLPNEYPLHRRIQPRRRVWSLLSLMGVPETWMYKRLGLTPIIMKGIARSKVERFVRAQGARVQAVERFNTNEGRLHSYYYILVRGHSPAI